MGFISRAKPKVGDSQFWTNILKVEDLFQQLCRWKLGDGHSVRFWEEVWVDDKTSKDAYPRLYLLSFDHDIIVVEALQKGWGGFTFRRTLYGESLEMWRNLKLRCEEIEMREGKDCIEWSLTRGK